LSPALDRHVVTAVLVAHEGARWLPETLKALLTQARPVQRFIAVDTGSEDRGPAVLTEVAGDGNLLRLPADTGYGAAVAQALDHPAASLPIPPPADAQARDEHHEHEQHKQHKQHKQIEWVWLLHDDSVPAHDALAQLLRVAESDPNAAVLGPKLRDWTDRRRLLELGVSIDGAGRRDTGVERLELDQGQHDGIRDVLGVSTAGMLVRRDVWEELGGLDQEFGLFRDDVDFGWRAHAAGHRVVLVSDAVVYHAEAARQGLRDIGQLAPAHAHGAGYSALRMDRRNALYVLLANLPLGAALRALARNLFGAVLRIGYLLITKRQQAARAEIAALGDVLRDPLRLRRARKARSANRRRVFHSVRRYQPRRVVLRRLVEMAGTAMSREREAKAQEKAEGPGLVQRLLGHPGLVVTAGLTAVSIAAERSLLAAGTRLGGGALVPGSGGASDLWAQYTAGWHPIGVGSTAAAPPSTAVLAGLSALTLGKPWPAVSLLLLGSVPLAGLTAYRAARRLIPEPPSTGRRALHPRMPISVVRAWLAVTYALLPVATGAIATGRIGTAVVHVLLPVIVLLAARMYGLPRRRLPGRKRQRRSAWGIALLLTIAMAFAPLIWPLAVVGGLLVWAAFAPAAAPRQPDPNLLIALGVPPLLLLPWSLGLLLHPSRFLLETGLQVSGGAAPAGALLALNPGGPGTPPPWALYGLLLIAVLALPLRSRRTAVLVGWMLGLLGLLTAVLASAAVVGKGADLAVAWPGAALLFAAVGLLLAAVAAVLRAGETLRGKDVIYRTGGAVIVLAAVSAPVLTALSWVAGGAGDPLRAVPSGTVPSFVSAAHGPRTLVLNSRGTGLSYSVLRGREPRLGEAEIATPGPARRRLDGLVAGLAAGRGEGAGLTRLGIQYVLVPRPAADPIAGVLDASPELQRLSRTESFGVWRLLIPAGRLTLVEGPTVTPLAAGDSGNARVTIPPGSGARTLVLAEPGGWRATLGGTALKPRTVDGWAQSYAIPAAGGEFVLRRDEWLRGFWGVMQGVAVLIVAVLALPGAQAEAPSATGRRRRGTRRAARLRSRHRAVQWEETATKDQHDQHDRHDLPDEQSEVPAGERS
jgi:GT2 family glycosyltransferase